MGDARTGDMTVTTLLGGADQVSVEALLARVADQRGFWPLSDQLVADLAHPSVNTDRRPISVLVAAPGRDELAGYAQASRREDGWTMQIAVDPRHDGAAVESALVTSIVDAIDRSGGGETDWWVYQPTDQIDTIASAAGFAVDRDLLQMRRDLPADRSAQVITRSFVVGQDEAIWLAVNNRAFAGHAEQGGWTIDTLRQRVEQPWFDPEGFRLHERDGRLAAFCWTKVHDGDQPIGEIYVIGVDPDFQGLGLGKELTLAGLDHMVARGIGHAMLYVDGANDAAQALYRRLGFVVHRTDRAFRRPSRVIG